MLFCLSQQWSQTRCVVVDSEMFGVSDHDLMFAVQASKAVEGDAESDDENNVRFIQDKVRLS